MRRYPRHYVFDARYLGTVLQQDMPCFGGYIEYFRKIRFHELAVFQLSIVGIPIAGKQDAKITC